MGEKKQIPGAGVPSPVPPKDAPLYVAIKAVFVNGRLYGPGEQFRSAEKPGRFWRLVEAGKPAAAPADAGGKSRGKGKGEQPAAPAAPAAGPAEAEGDTGRAADQSPI